jgi:hypothetical protein
MEYLRLLYKYKEIFPPGNLGAFFTVMWPGLGRQLGWLTTIILGVMLIIEGWLALKREFRHYYWVACLIIVITQWIGISTSPVNYVVLLLPLILVMAMLTERWPRGGQWVAVITALVLFAWEWTLYFRNQTGLGPEKQLNLLIPMPLILLLGLYWVRWWAIRPKRMLIEEPRLAETF